MKKKSARLHNFILRSITDVAIFVIMTWWLAYDRWPKKSVLLAVVAVIWMMTFIEVNHKHFGGK